MNKHHTKALPTTFAQAKLFTSCLYVIRDSGKNEWIICSYLCTKLLFYLFLQKEKNLNRTIIHMQTEAQQPEIPWIQMGPGDFRHSKGGKYGN